MELVRPPHLDAKRVILFFRKIRCSSLRKKGQNKLSILTNICIIRSERVNS